MTVRAVIFDFYQTLLDIWTDEGNPEVWARLTRFLTYHGVWLDPAELSARFFAGTDRQRRERGGEFPEVDVDVVFRDILAAMGSADADSLAAPVTALFRTLSLVQFRLFTDVLPTLAFLRGRVRIGIVSDAQRAFFRTELAAAGLTPFIDTAVASGEHGFHKPDPRLFHLALSEIGVPAIQAVYVGDSVDRDLCGARAAGLHPVLLDRYGDRGPLLPQCPPAHIVHDLREFCGWLGAA